MSNCADRYLALCIAELVGEGGLEGAPPINVGIAQVTGRAPCDVCQQVFQQLADYTGGQFDVYWATDFAGTEIAGPMTFLPVP